MNKSPIIVFLDGLFRPMGFLRKKSTWNRENGQFVDVIDVQVDKSESSMTLNVGVLEKGVYYSCWGRDAGPLVEEPFCTVRARIGELMDGKDKWWPLRDIDAITGEIEYSVKQYAIPFIDRMHSLEHMYQWLISSGAATPRNPLAAICVAILQDRMGAKKDACLILAELRAKALGAWSERANEVSERIGCT